MPAKIETEQRRAMQSALQAAREGNAELARQHLKHANDLYPITRRQRATVQHALTQHEKQNRTKAGSSL